jgi:hypothetical protein
MVEPGIYNITCPQGATFSRRFTYSIGGTAVNLGGYTAALQVREQYDTTPVLSLTSGSGITLGGTAGTIDVVVASTASAAITAGQYLYDLELTTSGTVTRLLQGVWVHTPEVTR